MSQHHVERIIQTQIQSAVWRCFKDSKRSVSVSDKSTRTILVVPYAAAVSFVDCALHAVLAGQQALE